MGKIRERMKADLELKGYADRTRDEYLRCAEDFVAHYMRAPEELGEVEVRCFVLHLIRVREVMPPTHKMYVAALKFLYEITLRKPEVVAHVAWPKVPWPLPDILSGPEVARLLGAIPTIKHRAIVTTAYATGMRITETCRLQVLDIDRERRVIHVRAGKGRKDRFVMTGDGLLACLRAYWRAERPPAPYLFPGRDPSRPITDQSVRKELTKAVAKSGITKTITPHVLRHSFASNLLDAGVGIRTIQALLGHSSIRSTARYTHVTAKHIADTPSPLDLIPPEQRASASDAPSDRPRGDRKSKRSRDAARRDPDPSRTRTGQRDRSKLGPTASGGSLPSTGGGRSKKRTPPRHPPTKRE